jgi:hypothetical protein
MRLTLRSFALSRTTVWSVRRNPIPCRRDQEMFEKAGNFCADDFVYTGKTTRGVGG